MVNKRLRFALAAAILSVCALTPAFSAGDATPSQYSLGDQTLSINAGMFLPFFFLETASGNFGGSNLSIGGVGSIDWVAYLAPKVRIGASIGGTFTFDPNWTALLMVPIVAKVSYLIQFYPWEIPLTFGAGMNILKYADQSTIDFLIKPGTGILWTYNSSWTFGINLNYWWDMQFAKDPTQSRIGNFMEVSLSAFYHY